VGIIVLSDLNLTAAISLHDGKENVWCYNNIVFGFLIVEASHWCCLRRSLFLNTS